MMRFLGERNQVWQIPLRTSSHVGDPKPKHFHPLLAPALQHAVQTHRMC